jgi:hypothetical protein
MKKTFKLSIFLTIPIVLGIILLNCTKKKTDPEPGNNTTETDTTTYIYHADNNKIQYSGRISFADPKKPKFSAPGVYIKAKFKGTSCTVFFNDQFLWGGKNYYDVIIDNITYKVTPVAGVSMYKIASNLSNGTHTVTFVKRTESSIGNCEFLGFRFGEIQSLPAKPTRKMQFIGNSISCGSGNEAANNSAQCSEDGWGQPYHNNYLAFGPVMARTLNAEYHVTAVSGIGAYRNYSGQYDARTMPQVYDLLYLESNAPSITWNVNQFVPDAIVIELGTNDFSPGDPSFEPGRVPYIDSATYVDTYKAFVTTLRGYYPNAHIFCLSSPMLGDGWPNASDKSATNLKNDLTGVVNYFNNNGDSKVHKFFVTHINGTGCGTHPSAAQHADIAFEVGNYVKSVMGW